MPRICSASVCPSGGSVGDGSVAGGSVAGGSAGVGSVAGGLLGGWAVSRRGLKFWVWPMLLAIHLPDAVFIWLAHAQPENLFVIGAGSGGVDRIGGLGVDHVIELARVLREDGTAFVITPNAPADFENPFHVSLFEADELESLLTLFFDDVTVHGLEGSPELHADFAQRRASGEKRFWPPGGSARTDGNRFWG